MRRRTSALPAVLALGLALATPAAAANRSAGDWWRTRFRPGVYVALAGTAGLDAEFGHSYSFVAASVLVPLLSIQQAALFGGGTGLTFDLSRQARSRWALDFFAFFVGGWAPQSCFFGGCVPVRDSILIPGVGLGVRYQHRDGFTFAIKLPLFGWQAGTAGFLGRKHNDAEGVASAYLYSALCMPLVSIGYTW